MNIYWLFLKKYLFRRRLKVWEEAILMHALLNLACDFEFP